MAVKFRHKETGLFWCRAKGLSPSRKEYYELGEESIFRKRHLSKRGAIYETATEKQKREWIGKKHAMVDILGGYGTERCFEIVGNKFDNPNL